MAVSAVRIIHKPLSGVPSSFTLIGRHRPRRQMAASARSNKPQELVDDLPDDGYVSEEDEDYDPVSDAPTEALGTKASTLRTATDSPGTAIEALHAQKKQEQRETTALQKLHSLGTVRPEHRETVQLALSGNWPKAPAGALNSVDLQLQPLQPQSEKATLLRKRKRDTSACTESASTGVDGTDLNAVAQSAMTDATTALETTGANASGADGVSNTVKVSEKQEFAGEEVEVEREVQEGSKAAKVHEERERQREATKGFDAVIAMMNGKKKLSTLDKSKLDWRSWKKQQGRHEQADLEKHVRSGTTHIERNEFLHKAEWAEYEKERDARLAADPRTRIRA